MRNRCPPIVVVVWLILPLQSFAAQWQWDGEAWADYRTFMSPITAVVKDRLKAIKTDGETQDRVPGRLAQIGDSITYASPYFRNVVGNGANPNETLHDYRQIRAWLTYEGKKDADANSFYRDHGKGPDYGNYSGWRLGDALSNGHPAKAVEQGDGTTPGNFSWALIMFGSNDVDDRNWQPERWAEQYKQFVLSFVELGVIPILSTIPPEQAHVQDGRVELANEKVREIAANLRIPYVDYYALIIHHQPIDWVGTLISEDGTHPSVRLGGQDFSKEALTKVSGYAMRSKLTLDMAEKLRAIVFENGEPES